MGRNAGAVINHAPAKQAVLFDHPQYDLAIGVGGIDRVLYEIEQHLKKVGPGYVDTFPRGLHCRAQPNPLGRQFVAQQDGQILQKRRNVSRLTLTRRHTLV